MALLQCALDIPSCNVLENVQSTCNLRLLSLFEDGDSWSNIRAALEPSRAGLNKMGERGLLKVFDVGGLLVNLMESGDLQYIKAECGKSGMCMGVTRVSRF